MIWTKTFWRKSLWTMISISKSISVSCLSRLLKSKSKLLLSSSTRVSPKSRNWTTKGQKTTSKLSRRSSRRKSMKSSMRPKRKPSNYFKKQRPSAKKRLPRRKPRKSWRSRRKKSLKWTKSMTRRSVNRLRLLSWLRFRTLRSKTGFYARSLAQNSVTATSTRSSDASTCRSESAHHLSWATTSLLNPNLTGWYARMAAASKESRETLSSTASSITFSQTWATVTVLDAHSLSEEDRGAESLP